MGEVMRHALSHLMNREVEVDAIDATFNGILREVTAQHITLWTRRGWLNIPHDRIKGVRAARPAPPPAGQSGRD